MSNDDREQRLTDCSLVREVLSAYIDEELSADAQGQIQGHLESCPACMAELEGLRATVAAIHDLPTDGIVPQDSWPEIAAATVGTGYDEAPRQERHFPRPLLWAAAIASLLIPAGATYLSSRSDDDAERRDEAVSTRIADIFTAAEEPSRTIQLPGEAPVLAITGVPDDAVHRAAFRLSRDAELRVIALGEGTDGEMYDYGWIEDSRTHQAVWRMEYGETGGAGGAEKNRFADATLNLPAGDYIAYYVTDDSHAFGDWNSSPPTIPEAWGLSLFPVSAADRRALELVAEIEEPNVLVQIIGVGEDERHQRVFELEEDTRVRIHALGEGSGEMYDYAWIADARGETIWQMEYEETTHAGGGEKNRLIDHVLTLPAGTYILLYESDGSHSFGDWNTGPPFDPFHWGVTLYRDF